MLGRKNKKQQNLPRQVQPQARPGAGVFSYHASRSVDQRNIGRNEPIVARSAKKLDFRYLPTWLSVAVIVFSAMYALTLGTDARVSVVQPGSSLTREPQVYQKAANALLADSIWNYTKLTVNTETVANKLQQQFPEIQNIAVTVPLLGRRPVIDIQTAEPAFLLASSTGGAYYVDNDGRVMVKAGDIKKTLPNIIIVRDQSGIELGPNKQVLPKQYVVYITTIINQLRAQNIPIDSFELPKVPYEVRLKVSGQPYYVRFNTELDGREQVGTYIAAKQKLEGDGKIPAEYIDVRVPERAYYK